MDCEHARQLLNLTRPLAPELAESEADALSDHVAGCAACAALDRLRGGLDERIGRAMRDVPVPPGLRDRITARLARDRRRWFVRSGLAAAAGLLLAIGLGWVWWPRPVVLDLAEVHDQLINLPTTAGGVEQLLADRGVRMKAPAGLNYALLRHVTMADFHGKRVPLLEYRAGPESAWVYVLNDKQFDLKALIGPPVGTGTSFTVECVPAPGDEHTAYLIITTGAGLEPFKKTPNAT